MRVVHALPERQWQVDMDVPPTARVVDAITKSGLVENFPGVHPADLRCAIFGRLVALSDTLADGDRIEVLRPLIADPKQVRRQAARAVSSLARTKKSGSP